MDGREFWMAVDAAPDLVMLDCVESVTPADDYVEVRYVPTGGVTRLPIREIRRCTKEDLFGVLRFTRKPKIMKAVSGDAGSYGQLPCVSRSIGPVAIAS